MTTPISYDTTTEAGQYFQTHQAGGDAWAQMQSVLNDYGLGSIGEFVMNGIIQNGWDKEQAVEHMRSTNEYAQRFSAIIERQKRGLSPISESEVLANERTYAQQMQAAGMPPGFYDNPATDFTNLLINDISPSELQSRITDGYLAAKNAPPEVKAALARYYGVTEGGIAAHFIDPTKSHDLIQRQNQTADIAGAATRTGFGDLGLADAERLQSLGVSANQAQTGFGALANEHELMNALPGQAGDGITQQQQLAAQFGGDAQQQQRIKDVAARRTADFAGGGGFTSNRQGYAGTGAAK